MSWWTESDWSPYNWGSDVVNWVGNVLGTDNTDQVNAANQAMEESKQLWENNKTANDALLGNYLSSVESMYGGAKSNRDFALSQLQSMQTPDTYSPSTFDYSKSVDEFMSPASALRVKTAQDAITQSQANARQYVFKRLLECA